MARRPSGTGSLYRPAFRDRHGVLRRGRVWWMAWPGAKPQSTGETSKAAAEVILRARLRDRDLGKRTEPALVTLDDLCTMVAADYKANARRSRPRVLQAAAQLVAYFGAMEKAAAITSDRITAYVSHRLDAKAAAATINRELSCLRRGFRLAARAGKVEHRPEITMLAEVNVRQGFVSRDQLDAIVAHLPVPARAPVLVAYLTGWRLHSEVLTRQWRHLDLAAGWLRLEPGETKNRKGRMFPLTAELRAILEAQAAERKRLERKTGQVIPWVFFRTGRRAAGKRIAGFRKAWITATTAAGLPGRLVHDLRRSAVRNLERAGVARAAAMAFTGHETESVYRRYAIMDESFLREQVAKLERKKR